MIVLIGLVDFKRQLVVKYNFGIMWLQEGYTYLVNHNFTHLLLSLLKYASTAMSDHIADILQSTTLITYYNDKAILTPS